MFVATFQCRVCERPTVQRILYSADLPEEARQEVRAACPTKAEALCVRICSKCQTWTAEAVWTVEPRKEWRDLFDVRLLEKDR